MRMVCKIVLAVVFCCATTFAQNKQLLYDFYEIPQSLMINPGVKTSHKWHVGVPVISGISVQGASSGVTVNDLFANDGVDFTTKVQERLLDVMGNRDDFGSTSQIEGFTIGFRGKNRPDDYYSFGMYGEMDVISYWPKDLAILAFEGNGGNNIGRNFDLGDLNVRGEMVNVFHFGINRKVNPDLTMGIRGKLYSSIFQFQSIKNSGSFVTTQGTNNIFESAINADMQLQTAGVKGFYDIVDEDSGTTRKDVERLFSKRVLLGGNLGLGLDFGFSHQLNQQTTITGSILDLGFIYNAKDVWNYTFSGSTVTDGISVILPDDINNLDNDLWQDLIDEIDEALPHGENQEAYISWRPVKLYGSIRYDFGEGGNPLSDNCGCAVNPGGGINRDYYRNSLGGQLFMIKRPKGIQPALTGFYQRRLGRAITLKATYTMDKYSYTNVGLGTSLQMGPVNFYVLADNLLSYSNLADSHYASLQFGFNIISWNDN
ncbi:DUF5723 family protein [Allomuricauda sp. XS_ASV26]|uniref:DUF5723 family protein n=1 Tax=Flavobacteriaceae TaxID=49546 RepID=UPI001CD7FCC2|nr:DUF5723 family protein [Allomuricauda ruestringensis]MCA0960099.1 DUF5723 family protein [Allomuricauda ruestringensis]